MSKRLNPSRISVTILVSLVVLGWVGYKNLSLPLPEADVTVSPVAGCDLNSQRCIADLPGGGRIELEITPHPIPVLKPVRVSATIAGAVANKLEGDLGGATMDMGYTRVTLEHIGNGRYAGDALIPVCITGRMTWRFTLIVESDRQRIAIPFLFEAPAH